ncbi:MAG: enoyl-CoA hydratase/isomerase family protein [Candidatus Eisenbacteria bacterium]|nr:enoyl-CoA hydratase/isomerase family protein [Candidatus Eisenbacteria bacterium]
MRIGLHPDWGGTYFLPRLVGLPRALELSWTGDAIDAEKAWRIGLVQRVVPDGHALEEARGLALCLAAAPQASIRLAKRTLGASLQRTLAQCLDAEAEAQEACWATHDVAEGLRAFVEKRVPVFGGAAPLEEAPSPAARAFE